MSLLRRSLLVTCGALALMTSASSAQQAAEKSRAFSAEFLTVKTSLEKYQDPMAAIRDGFLSTTACVGYGDGNMGVHFINMGNVGPAVDPQKPQVLIYEPSGDKLKLVAAEWFVPLATGVKERPTLLGQPFDGPMDGHEPLMPKELAHYDLHVWFWKDNAAGPFNSVNKAVSCNNYGYSFVHPEASNAHFHKH